MNWFRLLNVLVCCFFFLFGKAQVNIQSEIDRLVEVFPYINTKKVNEEITSILSDENKVKHIFGKESLFLDSIRAYLRAHNIPPELAYLPGAASGFNPFEKSPYGGTGIWLFKYGAAKKYGLTISSYVDERRDPIKSSRAAAQYLSDLYAYYGDWNLCILAFYLEPVELNKASILANEKCSVEKIKKHLPSRAENILSKFIAYYIVAHNKIYFNLESQSYKIYDGKMVKISGPCHLNIAAKLLDISKEKLLFANPVYKRQFVPQSSRNYFLYLPKSKIQSFYRLEDSLYALSKIEKKPLVKTPTPPPAPRVVQKPQKSLLYYTIRPGDYLGKIADLYDVGISQLKSWNGIRGSKIRSGQKLKVYVSRGKYSYYKKINGMSNAQKAQIMKRD
ncbi:MAG: transglycosylase SLT domain-containing protein [Bacteroidota bacterium]|nr:transglycosylase SLT domain-containing protein [Bacteroidota bacterium]